MLTKEQKREQSDQLKDALSDISTLFLLENTGLNVNDVNVLRSEIRNTEGTYKVVKNSVVKLAVEGTDLEVLAPHMTGPKTLAFTDGDAVALAKVLKTFIKNHPELSIQHAFLEGQLLDAKAAEFERQLAVAQQEEARAGGLRDAVENIMVYHAAGAPPSAPPL